MNVRELHSFDVELEERHEVNIVAPQTAACDHAQVLKSTSSHLSMMHLNTQSLTSTFDQLEQLISDYPFDIVTLSET